MIMLTIESGSFVFAKVWNIKNGELILVQIGILDIVEVVLNVIGKVGRKDGQTGVEESRAHWAHFLVVNKLKMVDHLVHLPRAILVLAAFDHL